LTSVERATLLRLTEPTLFDGAAEYRRQVDHAMVVGQSHCGCPTIDLVIDRSLARRSPRPGTPLLPVKGVLGEGEDRLRLVCFAPDGWLERLEVVASTPPAEFPDPRGWQLM
jgi:hypothetical protein